MRLLLTLLLIAVPANKAFIDRAKGATALLYAQDASGTMTMRCTLTAIARGDSLATKGAVYRYEFAGAAHCIGVDDVVKERVASYRNIPFYVTFDDSRQKKFYAARVLEVGYQHRGDDFAVFEVRSDEIWPVVPVGDERKEEEGNAVINLASPLGLGRQVFHGHISKMELDRPLIEGDINWRGAMLLQMSGTNGGSSGSAIMSEEQEAIVGFLVGTIGGTSIAAIPASKFSAFRARVAAGMYRWADAVDSEQ